LSQENQTVASRQPIINEINEKVTMNQDKLLARQAFYYLKYCLHTHTHHSHTAESLTTVHEKSIKDSRDIENLLRDLKRGINDYRTQAAQFTHTVSGIALYGKSLLYSARLSGLVNSHTKMDAQLAYLDNVRSSIDLCGPPQTKTALSLIFEKTPKLIASVFLLLGPLLLYLNTRVNDAVNNNQYIKDEQQEICGSLGSYEATSNLCVLAYGFTERYVTGVLAPSIATIIFTGMLVTLITVILVKLGSHAESPGIVHRAIRKLSLSTHSFYSKTRFFSNFRLFLYPVAIFMNHARNTLIPLYKPKMYLGLALCWIGLSVTFAAFVTSAMALLKVFPVGN